MTLTEQQTALLDFVISAHGTQIRKYTGEPYWHHVYNVATIVDDHGPHPAGLIEIALCHDLFEDTTVNYERLQNVLTKLKYQTPERIFILRGVEALTDVMTSKNYPDHNRAERKLWEARRLGRIDGNYQTVKYADLLDNTSSITVHDPGFAKIYLAEKRELIERMRNGNLDLLVQCYNTVMIHTV